jgi:methionyl-tRNA formyltransferase
MTGPRALRVGYLGNDPWSVPPLEALAGSRHHVVRVITRVPRPGRRGGPDVPTPVADRARALDLPVSEVETVRSGPGLAALAAAPIDVLVVVAYGEILPAAVLEMPLVAPVNLHFSLLPALRGASPVQTALLRGLRETGVTTIVMDEGLDTGDVLLQERVEIDAEDDAGSLGERLARVGGVVVVRTLEELSSGTARRVPQDGARATYARKLTPDDRRIDWSRPATDIVNRVRALAPEPAVTTTLRETPLKLFRARTADASAAPGEIVHVDREGFVVGAGAGAVRILELAPAGRSRMPAAAFVNGFRPGVGERLS